MTKNKLYIPTIIGFALAAGLFIGSLFNKNSDYYAKNTEAKSKLNNLIDYIEYEYVNDIDTDSIADIAVKEILNKLDPHTNYLSTDQIIKSNESINGSFVGIGVQYFMVNDTISIINTLENGPSKKVGIKSGDQILIANKDTLYNKNLTSEDVSELLKGNLGSKLSLKIYRKSQNELLTFNLTRNDIPVKSISSSYILKKGIGYIKLNQFGQNSYKEFKNELIRLKSDGMTKLVLDLRDNPGGILQIASNILNEFSDNNTLLFYSVNKNNEKDNYYADERGIFKNDEVVILINENSASASEVVAGSLQDNDRATIIGRRSYGKGLVQRDLELGDGSVVRMTVAKYYTPTGRSIQRPFAKGREEYENDFWDRYYSGELKHRDSIPIADSLKFTTKKGKTVFGGGGIIPDIFIPIDEEDNIVQLITNPMFLDRIVFDYLDKDRAYFQSLTENEFYNDYEVKDDLLYDLRLYFRQHKIDDQIINNKELIKNELKAVIASQIFNDNLAVKIRNLQDKMIKEILYK